ncbi:MAG: hypothetical protein JWM53_6737, partial [bacterium]|nr:hypothetical protein [bacterium]
MKLHYLVVAAALGAGCSGTIDAPSTTQPTVAQAKHR